MLDAALLAACAPQVHPATMVEVIRVESGGEPLAINVNRLTGPRPPRARTVAEAAAIARDYITRGFRVDLGLGQITDRNLPMLGLSLEQVFEPCTNLQAAALILSGCYDRAVRALGAEGQPALRAALSCYNTGDLNRGFRNGYVARYVPALQATPPVTVTARAAAPPAPSRHPAAPDPWAGYGGRSWEDVAAAPKPVATAAADEWGFR